MAFTKRLSPHGLLRLDVRSLVVIVLCNLLLASAHPSAALIKLLAARHSHGSRLAPAAPYTSSSSNSRNRPFTPADDVTEVWPLDSSNVEGDDEAVHLSSSDPDDVEDHHDTDEDAVQRTLPHKGFLGHDKRASSLSQGLSKKHFLQGFFGSRGKRGQYSPALAPAGQGEEAEVAELEEGPVRRFDPSGFYGSRGKRFIPGLEALFLSQMYKSNLDAEKLKRQSMKFNGFYGSRG